MTSNYRKGYPFRVVQYVLGLMIIGLGVNTLLRSQLGAGAWDTVTFNLAFALNRLSERLDLPFTVTLGMSSFLIQSTLLVWVISVRKSLRYLFILVPIFSISIVIDFWDLWVFADYFPETLLLRYVFYVSGLVALTFGLVLVILTRFPAAIFDEVMLLVMRLTKNDSVFVVRTGVELFALITATVIGFASGLGFGAVNVGSLVLALALPPLLSWQIQWMKRWFDAYELA